MIYKSIILVLIILTLALTGCATTVVPKPGKITLEDAMISVGTGLRAMRAAEGDLRTGLIADEVEVIFNVSASGEQEGKLYVEMTPIATSGVKGGAEASTKYSAQRGNQVTVRFKNILTATNSPIIDNVTQLKALLKVIQESGPDGVFYFIPPELRQK